VISAFGEAFNNIALHGYGGAASGPIRVEVEWDEEKLVIVVMDRGRTFDLDNVLLPDLDAMQESGMGVFIMRSCMDEVDYHPGPPNVLRLVKLRRPRTELPVSRREAAGAADLPGESARELEQSAWRMKAVRGQSWGLDLEAALEPVFTTEGTSAPPVTTGGTPVPPGMDERMVEGSRRR
jgi:Histidine kinase-like ATPase domain